MRSPIVIFIALLALLASPPRAEVAGDAVQGLTALAPIRGAALTPAAVRNRVVVVAFFASWCPPCHTEFRHLKAVQAEFGERVTIVAVNYFEDFGGLSSPKKLVAFLDRHRPNFYLLAGTGDTGRDFDDLDRIPSLFVFDRRGRLAWRFRHARGAKKSHVDKAELQKIVQNLL